MSTEKPVGAGFAAFREAGPRRGANAGDMLDQTHRTWHFFLTQLTGWPDGAYLAELAPVLASVRAAQEMLLQLAVDRRSGLRPELLRVPPEGLAGALESVARGLDPVPADLAWTLLADQQRDVVAALEEPVMAGHPESMAMAGRLMEHIGQAAVELSRRRGGGPPGLIFHMTAMADWLGRTTPDYRHPSLESEGFLHFTDLPELVEEVAHRYFEDVEPPMALLVVDVSRVGPELRWEGDPHPYPHVYGPLNVDAVRDVRRMDRPAGRWRFPGA